MGRYIIRKLLSFATSLLVISFLTFVTLNVLPGDPAVLILGTEGSPEALANLRDELGLNNPVLVRFGSWLLGFVQGDFGNSIRFSTPVQELVQVSLPVSLSLAFAAVSVAILLALVLGVNAAVKQGKIWDNVTSVFSQLGMAVPQFWIGILAIQYFAVQWRLLPAGGYDGLASLILPALTLCLPRTAVLTRMVRAGLVDVLDQDYVRTARSKGLPERKVLYKHALANGAIGVFTIAGIQLTQLFAGTIVIEQVFGLPGMGQLLLTGVLQRDLPLVQGIVVVAAGLILMANLFFDIILMFLDPRVRFE